MNKNMKIDKELHNALSPIVEKYAEDNENFKGVVIGTGNCTQIMNCTPVSLYSIALGIISSLCESEDLMDFLNDICEYSNSSSKHKMFANGLLSLCDVAKSIKDSDSKDDYSKLDINEMISNKAKCELEKAMENLKNIFKKQD